MKISVENEGFNPNECPAYGYTLLHDGVPLKSNKSFLGTQL